jgi:hypothetical protein
VALRTTFQQLVEMVCDEVGSSSATSRGNDALSRYRRIIQRVYETLYDSFDWTFATIDNDDATKYLQAGERYYDFPVAMDMDSKYAGFQCWYYYSNVWIPLTYGIGPPEYTAMNPELDQRADPAMRWRVKDYNQFEIWPPPATNGDEDSLAGPKVRFIGRRAKPPLNSDQARALMDDQLIVLYASAEILSKKDQKDADMKLAAANARKIEMRRLYSARTKIRVGMGSSWNQDQYGWPRIRAFPAAV